MSDHFIGLRRDESGLVYSNFIHGTASSAGSDIELRIRDGAGLSRKEVIAALVALERFVATEHWVSAAGIDVKA